MQNKCLSLVIASIALVGCSDDYAGFCEEVAMQLDSPNYDKFDITEIIDYTANEEPRAEVYVRITAIRPSNAIENRNVACIFDFESEKIIATEIIVDGRKLKPDMLAQYNAILSQQN